MLILISYMLPYTISQSFIPQPDNIYTRTILIYFVHDLIFTFIIFGFSDRLFLAIGLYDKVEEGYEFKDSYLD